MSAVARLTLGKLVPGRRGIPRVYDLHLTGFMLVALSYLDCCYTHIFVEGFPNELCS